MDKSLENWKTSVGFELIKNTGFFIGDKCVRYQYICENCKKLSVIDNLYEPNPKTPEDKKYLCDLCYYITKN